MSTVAESAAHASSHTEQTQEAPNLPHKKSKRSVSPSVYNKPCTICQTPRDVLVRCRVDESQIWHFVCPGKCWRNVSGGHIDGLDRPYYRYGGMWKNKHAGVSAKKPKARSKRETDDTSIRPWSSQLVRYSRNDKAQHQGYVWSCRRSHESGEKNAPGFAYRYWKECSSTSSAVVMEVNEVEHDHGTFQAEATGCTGQIAHVNRA